VPLCVLHDEYDWCRSSLDGWVEELGLGLEIKAPNRDDHRCALDGKVPEKYYPQVLHQLLVTGAVAWHYVSQGDERSFPMAKRLAIVSVTPRREELQALLDLEIAFMRQWKS
jgi:hypothetical protein